MTIMSEHYECIVKRLLKDMSDYEYRLYGLSGDCDDALYFEDDDD